MEVIVWMKGVSIKLLKGLTMTRYRWGGGSDKFEVINVSGGLQGRRHQKRLKGDLAFLSLGCMYI